MGIVVAALILFFFGLLFYPESIVKACLSSRMNIVLVFNAHPPHSLDKNRMFIFHCLGYLHSKP